MGGKGYPSAGAAGFISRRAEAGEKGGEAGVVGERDEGGLAGDGIEQGGLEPERELEVGQEVGFGAASGRKDGQAEVPLAQLSKVQHGSTLVSGWGTLATVSQRSARAYPIRVSERTVKALPAITLRELHTKIWPV